MCWKISVTLQSWGEKISVPAPPSPSWCQFNTTKQYATCPQFYFVLGEMCWRPRAFCCCLFSTLYQSNENGYGDYMCKCTKSVTLQRYIIPKLQKNLKHAFNFLKGCWMLPLKKRWLFSKSATAGEDFLAQLWPAYYCCIFLIISADTGGWKLIVWCRRPWAVL